LQSEQLVGVKLTSLNKNISFLIKYGVLVLVLSINYALNKPPKQPSQNPKQPSQKLISSSDLNFSENKQKNTTLLSTEYQQFINYFITE